MVGVAKEKREIQLRRAIRTGGVLVAKIRGRTMVSISEVRDYFRPTRPRPRLPN